MRAIVGVMIVMAVIGLSYALWTVQERRARDPKGTLDPVKFRRPLELEGLGYLPKDGDIVVGVHIAEWLDDAKAGALITNEPRPLGLDWLARQIARTTAMELKEIDHVVLSLSFEKQTLTAVVKTRRPMIGEKIAEHGPAKSSLHEGLPLYEFELQPAGGALVWWLDAKTAVYTMRFAMPTVADMKGLSKMAQAPQDVLAAPLHAAVKDRLTRYQVAWAVGRLDRLGALRDAAAFVPAMKRLAEGSKDVKTFAFGLEPIEGLTLTGHLQTHDAKAATKLKALLDGLPVPESISRKVDVPPADVKEPWVTWQVRGEVTAVRAWLAPPVKK
jgi:hypothetical protein